MRAWADLCGCVYMTVFLCLRVRVNLLSERFRLSNKITRKQIRALSAFYYSREEHDKKTDYWQELGGSRQEGSGAGVGGLQLVTLVTTHDAAHGVNVLQHGGAGRGEVTTARAWHHGQGLSSQTPFTRRPLRIGLTRHTHGINTSEHSIHTELPQLHTEQN